MSRQNRLFARLGVEGVLVLFLLVVLFSTILDQRQTSDLAVSRAALRQGGLAQQELPGGILTAGLGDLNARWFGIPALWQPPPISHAEIRYFDITGTSQQDLIDSLDGAGICKKYGPCLKDPANPTGIAWGLEGVDPGASYYICYAPASTTLDYREWVLLPRWAPLPLGGVRVSVVVAWNALQKVIYTHEAGHVAISVTDIAALNAQARQLATCDALAAFWDNPRIWDKLNADQLAYHARLRADCRPEVGCIPRGWMGW